MSRSEIIFMNLSPIDSVKHRQLELVKNHLGDLTKILDKSSPGYVDFGEAYLSQVLPGRIKAWRAHTKLTSNLTVVAGSLLAVISPNDSELTDESQVREFHLDALSPTMLSIPPTLWYGFKAGASGATILNFLDDIYSEDEVRRLPHDSDQISYSWGTA